MTRSLRKSSLLLALVVLLCLVFFYVGQRHLFQKESIHKLVTKYFDDIEDDGKSFHEAQLLPSKQLLNSRKREDEARGKIPSSLDDGEPKPLLDSEEQHLTSHQEEVELTEDQKALVMETLRLHREVLLNNSVGQFMDVPKIGVDPSIIMKNLEKYIVKKNDNQILDPYTIKKLKERAKDFDPQSEVGKFLAEQKRRRLHVKDVCRSVTTNIAVNEKDLIALTAYPNLIHDRVDHLTFCPVYKAASTSWSINLLQLSGMFSTNKYKKHGLQSMLSAIYPKLSSIVGPTLIANTIKFMVVRNPFERLVSCYRDKYEGASKYYYYKLYGEKMVYRYRTIPDLFNNQEAKNMLRAVRTALSSKSDSSSNYIKLTNYHNVVGNESTRMMSLKGNVYAEPIGPTFEEFVKYIVAAGRDDEHWRPYFSHCATCFVDYDYVLRFESLYDESKNFIEFLNRTKLIAPRWDNMADKGVSTGEVACEYFGKLTVKLAEDLIKKYANDFVLFEYSPDGYVKCTKDYTADVKLNINVPVMSKPKNTLVDPFR